jgi:hypothetical protein
MKLETELRRALAREQPPKDFAERVAARIDATKRRTAIVPAARHRVIGLALAATLVIGTGSTIYVAHRRQVAEAERVRDAERMRDDAVTGLRIASAKLNDVYERLQRISSQNERTK